jgi:hypothetical protein
MLGDNIDSVGWPSSGEIDIMENIGRESNLIHGSLHGPGYSGGNPLSGTFDLGRAFADDFHTFAVDWTPGQIAFSVDGQTYARHTPAETNGSPWVFNRPFVLILNLAIGGNWPGPPDAATAFPQQMVVDYVHVFDSPDGATAPSTSTAVSRSPDSQPTSTPSPAPGGSSSGAILGYWGQCVDVDPAARGNGSQVQLRGCNRTDGQQWARSGSTIRALGRCLDAAGSGTADGTGVVLLDCDGTSAQGWTYTDGQLINVGSGKCLDSVGRRADDGTPLHLWTCQGGPSQRWLMVKTSSEYQT